MPLNPSDRPCWRTCPSCYKCSNKGQDAKCQTCSGRHDPGVTLKFDPYDIDCYCDCRNGILRHRTQDGRLIVRHFLSDPFGGKVSTDAETEDERDWNAFVAEKREYLNDPNWDPLEFADGGSTDAWLKRWQLGMGEYGY